MSYKQASRLQKFLHSLAARVPSPVVKSKHGERFVFMCPEKCFIVVISQFLWLEKLNVLWEACVHFHNSSGELSLYVTVHIITVSYVVLESDQFKDTETKKSLWEYVQMEGYY
jgi:hypothetical protein